MEDDPEFHLTSYGDVRTYVDELESLREAAFDNPLTAGTTFTLVLKQVTLHPHGRPLPRFAAQLPETGAVYSVILDRVLQTGCDAWGQVWLACVTDPASPDQVLGNIVVKLVQPSLLYHPDPTSFYQMCWTSPKKVAHTEDWAYRKLRSIQGCEIPYYYGMQTVVTPSGERAWILAMEYVEGQTICQWLDSSHNKDSGGSLIPKDLTPEMFKKLKTLFVDSLESIRAIHAQGVYHGDVQGQNMILSAAFPAGSHIVFVDLAEAMAIDDDDAGDLVRLDEEGIEACLASCACCDEHWIPVQEWAKEGPLPNGLEYPDPYQT